MLQVGDLVLIKYAVDDPSGARFIGKYYMNKYKRKTTKFFDMKNLILICFLFLIKVSYSQPPAESIANDEEKILIDVLIEVSLFKAYFVQRASSMISSASWEKKWDDKQVLERKEKISAEQFLSQNNMYNLLSYFTKKELEELIDFSRKINTGNSAPKVCFTTSLLESRINQFVDANYLR